MTNTESKKQPTHDEIAARAYQLWEAAGRNSGHDQEYWYQAIAHLSAQGGNRSTASAGALPATTASRDASTPQQQTPGTPPPAPKSESQKKRKAENQSNGRRPAFV